MVNRIYFLTSEIIPFAETYRLATFSKEIPVVFNERKYDFRLMMPKYGFISERRYILREVIRLRDMDLIYRGKKEKASVKSAFIPNTKVQIYFLEHESYYGLTDTDLYIPKNKKDISKNSVRFSYFATAALTTLKYLRWKPEVIICNDWQMEMIPLIIYSNLLDNGYFEGVKIILLVHSKTSLSEYSISEYKNVGLDDIKSNYIKGGKLNCLAAAIPLCDHTVIIDAEDNISEQYKKDASFKDLFNEYGEKISSYSLKGDSPEQWQKLADEVIKIMEKL